MKFYTPVYCLVFTLLGVVYGASECDNDMRSAFDALAEKAKTSKSIVSGNVPESCIDISKISDSTSIDAEQRTDFATYCSAEYESIDITVDTYSYDLSLTGVIGWDTLNIFASIMDTFNNTSNVNNCGSNLFYQPSDDSSGQGWNIWAESYDTTSASCTRPIFVDIQGAVAGTIGAITEQQKTSFCVIYDSAPSWRGVVRGLYSNETRYDSVASIPCYVLNPGFAEVDNCMAV